MSAPEHVEINQRPLQFSAPVRPRAKFDRDLSALEVAPDHYRIHLDSDWQVVRGPNGGYLAALLLQTMQRRLSDPTRKPRVLSVQYPSVPRPGPVQIRTRVLRSGRSTSWLSAELHQDGEPRVVARAAFSADWPSLQYTRVTPPTVPGPEQGLPVVEGMPPFTSHFHYRSLFATPMARDEHSDAVGGYIKLREPRPYDAPLLAALSDAWFPSTFAHDGRWTMAATLDLTVHFRDHAALETLTPDDWALTIFRSRLAHEGFFEEDGELFTPDGRLIAQSRQLAIAAPLSDLS